MAYVSSVFGAINTEKSQKNSEKYPKSSKKLINLENPNNSNKFKINPRKFK
jgi:hypothetical protein